MEKDFHLKNAEVHLYINMDREVKLHFILIFNIFQDFTVILRPLCP